MGLDPKALPQRIIDLMEKPERKDIGVKTSGEIAEKIEVENERELQNQCANLLRLRSIWFFQSRMDRRTTNPVGTPDFLFAVKGTPIAVECKIGAGILSREQEDSMYHMAKNGWICAVVRSVKMLKDLLDDYS